MRWRDQVQRGVSVLETDRFAPGIPARCEAREVCFTAGKDLVTGKGDA